MKWVGHLEKYLKALERANFPRNAICTHHGVYVHHPYIEAGISIAPQPPAGMLIMMYGNGVRGFSKRTFDRWRAGVSTFGKIVETWNGGAGHSGISIVVDRKIPGGFNHAIANYHDLPSPFSLRPEDKAGFKAFDHAWEAALKKQGVKL